jgi:predicted transcriptional regulator
MPITEVHKCQCNQCQEEANHTDKIFHRQMNLLISRLDEQQRRWYIAVEANRIGHGGIRKLSQITGMDEKTIQRGQQELEQSLVDRPSEQIRLPGGGRQRAEKKTQG